MTERFASSSFLEVCIDRLQKNPLWNMKRNEKKNFFWLIKLLRKDSKWSEQMWLPHTEWASPILSFSTATWMSWHPHNTSCWFEGRRFAQVKWCAVMHHSVYLSSGEKPPVALFFFLFACNKSVFSCPEKAASMLPRSILDGVRSEPGL